MDIPETPEALFEALAEPSLRQVYPRFDDLKPRNQKLIRLLHTELTKGELTDLSFMEFVGFVIVLWRSFNNTALSACLKQIESEDEIDTDWVDSALHLSRMDQYLVSLIHALEPLPGQDGIEGARGCDSRYLLRSSEDASFPPAPN